MPTPAALLLHTVTPVAVALDWLFLTRPGTLRLHHAALWLAYPVAYTTCVLTVAFPAPAPYAVLNATHHDNTSAPTDSAILLLALYALALSFILLDRLRTTTPKSGFRLRPPVG